MKTVVNDGYKTFTGTELDAEAIAREPEDKWVMDQVYPSYKGLQRIEDATIAKFQKIADKHGAAVTWYPSEGTVIASPEVTRNDIIKWKDAAEAHVAQLIANGTLKVNEEQ